MALIAVDGVLPDTSVKLGTKDDEISPKLAHLYNGVCIIIGLDKKTQNMESWISPCN